MTGDGTSPDNTALNCAYITNTFQNALYDDDGNRAQFWQPLSPTINVALKGGFMGIGGKSVNWQDRILYLSQFPSSPFTLFLPQPTFFSFLFPPSTAQPAPKGLATASSKFLNENKPDDAINGDKTDFMHTTANAETDPWLNIQLPTMVRVTKVVVTNRPAVCQSRLFFGSDCVDMTPGSVFDGPNQGP